MNKYVKSALCITLGTMILFNPLSVSAEKMDKTINPKDLYLIEKDIYKEILKTNTGIIVNKDNLLAINSSNVTQDELDTINNAKSVSIFGDLANSDDILKLDNFKSQIFHNGESLDLLEHDESDKDLLIVNKESLADLLSASQLGDLENRNILLIEDILNENTKTFIKEKGKDKNILFLEGELAISDNLKEEIMNLTNNRKFELNKVNIAKLNISAESNYQVPLAKLNIESNLSKDVNAIVSNKEESLLSKVNQLSGALPKKSQEETNELLMNKSKIIAFETKNIEENVEIEEIKEDVNNDNKELKSDNNVNFLDLIDKFDTLEVNKENKVDTEEKDTSITLTYAQPIELHSEIKEDLEEFIVKKEITNDLILEVMEGSYGNGSERKVNLEKEGYNSDEIQKRIDKIIEERNLARQADIASRRQTEISNKSTNPKLKLRDNAPTSSLANSLINEAVKMNGWEYSQAKRWQQGYADCSSIILRAMLNAGITKDNKNLTTSTIASDYRFKEIFMSAMQPGDILWKKGHIEIYVGGNQTFGAFRPGKPAGYGGNINRFTKAYRMTGK